MNPNNTFKEVKVYEHYFDDSGSVGTGTDTHWSVFLVDPMGLEAVGEDV